MNKRNVIVLVVIGLSVAACGSSDGRGDGVASLGRRWKRHGPADANDAAPPRARWRRRRSSRRRSNFSRCMEDQGVDMPACVTVTRGGDQSIAVGGGPLVISGDDGETRWRRPPADDDSDDQVATPMGGRVGPPSIDVEEMEAANEACRGHLENAAPDFDLTPEQEAAMEDARLEFDGAWGIKASSCRR